MHLHISYDKIISNIALASLYVRLTCYEFVQAQAGANEFNGLTGGEWNG